MQSFDHIDAFCPPGAGLSRLQAMVADDLVEDEELIAIAGDEQIPIQHTDLPRLRPILVALAARASGAERVEGDAQFAAELLHAALSVHDLALGREGGLRRRAARRIVRRGVGWLSGNHLWLRALELTRHGSPETFAEIVDTLRGFQEAQALSRDLYGKLPTYHDWEEHADGHTGALFAFCCRAGGAMGRTSPAQKLAFARYGRHLGRLWHMAEDVSSLDQGVGALHLLTRASRGRPVLPVVLSTDDRVGALWKRLALEESMVVANELAVLVIRDGLQQTRRNLALESWSAQQALAALPDSVYRTAMRRLVAGIAKASA